MNSKSITKMARVRVSAINVLMQCGNSTHVHLMLLLQVVWKTSSGNVHSSQADTFKRVVRCNPGRSHCRRNERGHQLHVCYFSWT